MAVKEIAPVKLEYNALSNAITFASPTAQADGFSVPYAAQDTKIVLLVQGGAAPGTLTVKKGDSIQGVVDTEAFPVPATGVKAIVLESGKFKNTAGVNKGKVIIIPSAADIKLAAVVLP